MNLEHLAIPESEKTLQPNDAQNTESSLKGPPTDQNWTNSAEKLLSTVIKYKPLGKRIVTHESILIINIDK